MGAQKVIRVKVTTTAATAEKDVKEAVEQALRVQYKENMGPVGAPVAAEVAGIMGQKAEEVVQSEKSERTLFIYDDFILDWYPELEAVKDYVRAEMQPRGKTIEYVEVKGGIMVDNLLNKYKSHLEASGMSLADAPKFDRVAVLIHAVGIIRGYTPEGEERSYEWPGLESYRPREVPEDWERPFPPVEAHELYAAVKQIIKEDGELWVFTCGLTQEQWDRAEGYWEREKGGEAGYFTIEIIPGTGADCLPRKDMPEYIRRAIED